MAVEVTDVCGQCSRTSHWPLEVYEATGGTCARCLEERPGLLLQLVAAEGHPYRAAPAYRRRLSPEARRLRVMLAVAVAAAALSGYAVATMSGVTTPRVSLALVLAAWVSMAVHMACAIRSLARS